jgi:N-acyl-D-aspartate/D-glutamate deacylase
MAKALVPLVASISLLALFGSSSQASEPQRFDVILRHGSILDGSGAPAYMADVGIRGGYITEIGDLSAAKGTKEVEARGLFVAPGFINVHDHSTPEGVRRAENMLNQGVTLGVANADGGGSTDLNREATEFGANGMAMNLAFSIGFNSVWAEVMGPSDRRASPADIARMQTLILQGLRFGAAGVSAGLDYKPAYFSTPTEAMSVLKVAQDWRTFFPNHDRVAPPDYSSYKGMNETIGLASSARIIPEITHIKIQGHEQGSARAVIGMMTGAAAKGHYVAADIYPYLAGNTGLGNVLIPGWAQDGGRPEMLRRFAQPEIRRRIAAESEDAMKARLAGGPAGIYIPSIRREFTDIMREEQAGPGETLIRVLEKNNPGAILRFGVESDMIALLKYPSTSITCDCGASVAGRGGGHPRNYGAFPRILGVYTRDKGVLTWQDAVRRMSGLPASTMGLVDRGFVAVGMRADITIFDPKTVRDHATYESPNEPSEGIRYVLVNGQLALTDGASTGIQSGQVVRLTTHMPSRPMANLGARWITSRATYDSPLGKVDLDLDVRQSASTRAATGKAQIRIGTSGWSLVVTRLGVLQVSHKWASFTGWGRTNDGREEPVTVILDAEGPGTPKGTIVLSVMTPDKTIEGYAPVATVHMNQVAAYR